jgi:hypothetical protein
MSKCNFSIPFKGSAEVIVEKARKEVQRYGFFQGDNTHGNFEITMLGTISGSYTINGGEMQIIIDNKPVFLTCSKIEQFMTDHFA